MHLVELLPILFTFQNTPFTSQGSENFTLEAWKLYTQCQQSIRSPLPGEQLVFAHSVKWRTSRWIPLCDPKIRNSAAFLVMRKLNQQEMFACHSYARGVEESLLQTTGKPPLPPRSAVPPKLELQE